MKPKLIFLLFAIAFLSVKGNCQISATEAESLEKKLNSLKAVNKLNYLFQLSDFYAKKNQEKAMKFSKEAYQLAKYLKLTDAIDSSLNQISKNYFKQRSYDSSTKYFKEYFEFLKSKKEDKKRLAIISNKLSISLKHNNKTDEAILIAETSAEYSKSAPCDECYIEALLTSGTIYYSLGEFSISLDYYFKALKFADKINQKTLISQLMNNIAMSYDKLDDIKNAMYYLKKSLAIKVKSSDSSSLANSYVILGNLFYKQEKYDSSLFWQFKAYNIYKESKDSLNISYIYNNIGQNFRRLGDYSKALEYFKNSLEIKKKYVDIQTLSTSYNNIIKVLSKLGKYESGLKYIDTIYNIIAKTKSIAIKRSCYNAIYEFYYTKNDFENALENKLLSDSLDDIIRDEKKLADINEIQQKYEVAQKESENKHLLYQNHIRHIYLIIISIASLIIITIIFIFYYSNKRKNIALTKRLKFITLIQELSSKLIKVRFEMIDNAISNALEMFCNFMELNECFIYYLNEDQTKAELKFQIGNQEKYSFLTIPDDCQCIEILRKNEIHFGMSFTNKMQIEEIQKLDLKQQIQNSLKIPLIANNKLIGFIAFKNIHNLLNNRETVDSLKLVGELFAGALTMKQSLLDIQMMTNATQYVDDSIYILDNENKIIFVNNAFCKTFGYQQKEILKKEKTLFIADNISSDLQSKNLSNNEIIIVCKDGTQFIGIITENAVFDLNGNQMYKVGRITDITQQKNIENQLRENADNLSKLNHTKDKFFSIIAHDLINPFNAIMGFSSLLQDEYKAITEADKLRYIENIKSASESAYKLIENLLEWARVQTGSIQFQPDMIDLWTITYESINQLKLQAEAKGVRLLSTVSYNTKAFADEKMIITVIRNLVSNAIKYSFPGGKVTVSSEYESKIVTQDNQFVEIKYVKVIIADKGIGISNENILKLFRIDEKFMQNGTNEEKGSGLGLIISREFIEKNNGKIWIESEPKNFTRLIFTLPLKPVQNS